MTSRTGNAYSKKQWFWAVNLIAVLGAIGVVGSGPTIVRDPLQVLIVLPYMVVGALLISWIFIAAPLAVAMRKPASWLRAAAWGGGTATFIAGIGFALAQANRWRAQADPQFNYQLGGGDYVKDVDGVLTAYGWQSLVQSNALFILLGVLVALAVRAILGPGKVSL